jgi:transposase-like protein
MWKYLYRAVDSDGNTLHFMLSAKRDGKAAACFFREVLKAVHTGTPPMINVDKHATYPAVMETLKGEEMLPGTTELRQVKYLNNVVEQDHRNIKRISGAMMGFKSFNSDRRTLRGIEVTNMIRKGQVKGIEQGDSVSQVKFIKVIFGIAP